jgi:hypothetical protein
MAKIGQGMEVYFRSYVFEGEYAPYYEAYKGHKFKVDHVMAEDDTGTHVALKCLDDPTVIVDGYVHAFDLKRA